MVWRRLGSSILKQPEASPQWAKAMMETIYFYGGVSLSDQGGKSQKVGWMGSEECLKNNEWEHKLRISEELHFVCRPTLSKHTEVLRDWAGTIKEMFANVVWNGVTPCASGSPWLSPHSLEKSVWAPAKCLGRARCSHPPDCNKVYLALRRNLKLSVVSPGY